MKENFLLDLFIYFLSISRLSFWNSFIYYIFLFTTKHFKNLRHSRNTLFTQPV